MADFRVNDAGVLITVTLNEDVEDATTLELLLSNPHGETKALTANLDTNDSPRIVKYITADGDFDVEGRWQAQVRIVQPGGKDRRSSIFTLNVEKALIDA